MNDAHHDDGSQGAHRDDVVDLAYSEDHTTYQMEEGEHRRSDYVLPIVLLAVTVFTTLWAGAYQTNTDPARGALQFLLDEPASLLNGLPFAGTLLAILGTHELGHYVFSRLHRMPATFPLFIPGPPQFIGTFGAIIRMRGPITDRKALFDIGVSGPIAGFVVAIMALVIGLQLSTVASTRGTFGAHFGEPLVFQLLAWVIMGPVPDGYEVMLHPVGFAAWFGLFITSLNLIPIGQLDGGHVACAMWGPRQRTMALAMVPLLLGLGFFGRSPTWFVVVALAGLVGLAHPPVRDPEAALGRARIWIGWLALLIFLVTFVPIPISIY